MHISTGFKIKSLGFFRPGLFFGQLSIMNKFALYVFSKARAGDFKFLEPVMNTFVSGNFAAHLQIPPCQDHI